MATSDVAICNLALDRLGADAITALTDNSTRAQQCARTYPDTRDRLLDEIRPNFAVTQRTFAQIAIPVGLLYGYSYAYQLPAGVLRILDVDGGDEDAWHRQGDTIVTDLPSLTATVVLQITDPTKFSPLFTEALVAQLAADLAYPVTKSAALEQSRKAEAEAAIAKAQAAEGQEGSTVVMQDDTLQRARR